MLGAEEPLPAGGSCLLGSINLAEFVENPFTDNAYINIEDLKNTVKIAVKGLNDILDEGLPLHPLEEQRNSVRDWRQIGLGIMGLADMLIKLKLTYGSDESLIQCEYIANIITCEALKTSCDLAKENGPYPKYNKNVLTTGFFLKHGESMNKYEQNNLFKYGLRNSQLLTIAPTGTLSTMLGISGGIEPVFANYYTRKTESLHEEDTYYKIFTPIAWNYLQRNNLGEDESKLPDYFITSQDIPYLNRIKMQGVWQQHIDASISSTVNLPNEATVEDIKKLYLEAWRHGLKGITVFRDGCRRGGILTTNSGEPTDNKSLNKDDILSRGVVLDVSEDLVGAKRKITTGCGGLHFELYADEVTGNPYETFINIGSSGGCERNYQLISRLISTALRGGVPIEVIIDQCMSIRPCSAYTNRTKKIGDTSKGTSCPTAFGYALKDLYKKLKENSINENDFKKEIESMLESNKCVKCSDNTKEIADSAMRCPECGSRLEMSGGCVICKGDEEHTGCGWSKCD